MEVQQEQLGFYTFKDDAVDKVREEYIIKNTNSSQFYSQVVIPGGYGEGKNNRSPDIS
jgi:hypothetical protein